MALSRALAVAATMTVLGACTLLRPLDGLSCEPGAGNASCLYGDSCDADADCATTACKGHLCQCPDDMVAIESQFCVDSTEVSNAAYRRFLDGHPAVGQQPAFCGWNTDFGFDEEQDVCKTRRAEDDYPATCIDWCDAYAFCQSLGKQLCGKVHVGANPDDGYKDPARSEWFAACSKGGALDYATGDLDTSQCNGSGTGAVPPGAPGDEVCEGGYPGLQHMSGNVREWEDSCSGQTGAQDLCLTRGGAFDSDGYASDLRCDVRDPRARNDTYYSIGFRCCGG